MLSPASQTVAPATPELDPIEFIRSTPAYIRAAEKSKQDNSAAREQAIADLIATREDGRQKTAEAADRLHALEKQLAELLPQLESLGRELDQARAVGQGLSHKTHADNCAAERRCREFGLPEAGINLLRRITDARAAAHEVDPRDPDLDAMRIRLTKLVELERRASDLAFVPARELPDAIANLESDFTTAIHPPEPVTIPQSC
jgi:hypothetical protein